jgi:hypothetical protein
MKAPVKPIIIFGTGRSGTTIFHRMLSEHPHLAWMSALHDRLPDHWVWRRPLATAFDLPVFGPWLRKRIPAAEGYRFWESHAKGFRRPCRDLVAADLSTQAKHDLRRAMTRLTDRRRRRLLLKVTGWPRLGYLAEVFPDAFFIHVIRDGRAVANSLVTIGFWQGWEGPEKWRWGPLSAAHHRTWYRYDQSFIVLAAIQWQTLMAAAEKAKRQVDPARLLEIRYETLCDQPMALFKEVADFCDLDWTHGFEKRLQRYRLRNTNGKYQEELSPRQQQSLNAVLREELARYGYGATPLKKTAPSTGERSQAMDPSGQRVLSV